MRLAPPFRIISTRQTLHPVGLFRFHGTKSGGHKVEISHSHLQSASAPLSVSLPETWGWDGKRFYGIALISRWDCLPQGTVCLRYPSAGTTASRDHKYECCLSNPLYMERNRMSQRPSFQGVILQPKSYSGSCAEEDCLNTTDYKCQCTVQRTDRCNPASV